MKKNLIVMLLLVMTAMTTSARNIWTGSKAVGWDDSFVLTTTELGTIHAGDCFVFTFSVTDPNNWPQFRIEDLSYNMLSGVQLSATQTTAKIYATQGIIDGIASGAKIRGTGCTMTSIDLIEGDGGDYSHCVWIGETTIGNWEGYQQVAPTCFVDVVVGQVMRIKFKELGAGAYLSLRNPVDG